MLRLSKIIGLPSRLNDSIMLEALSSDLFGHELCNASVVIGNLGLVADNPDYTDSVRQELDGIANDYCTMWSMGHLRGTLDDTFRYATGAIESLLGVLAPNYPELKPLNDQIQLVSLQLMGEFEESDGRTPVLRRLTSDDMMRILAAGAEALFDFHRATSLPLHPALSEIAEILHFHQSGYQERIEYAIWRVQRLQKRFDTATRSAIFKESDWDIINEVRAVFVETLRLLNGYKEFTLGDVLILRKMAPHFGTWLASQPGDHKALAMQIIERQYQRAIKPESDRSPADGVECQIGGHYIVRPLLGVVMGVLGSPHEQLTPPEITRLEKIRDDLRSFLKAYPDQD